MAIKELYRNFLVQIQQIYGLSEATVICNWVFENIAAIKQSDLVKNPALQLNGKTIEQLNDAFARLLQHEPIQYVLEEAWFYNLKLKVNKSVLIPRPETEELVELIISSRRSKLTDPAILDIGTGSGCIPVAIKKNLPASVVSALDVSESALNLAKENAFSHHTQVNFILMDFLNESQWDLLPEFDIIISNPPYIPEREKAKLSRNVVDFEPPVALFVPDNDPLLFYKKIALFSRSHLRSNGSIYMEMHEDLAKEALALLKKDYPVAEIKKDMFGKERMIIVTT